MAGAPRNQIMDTAFNAWAPVSVALNAVTAVNILAAHTGIAPMTLRLRSTVSFYVSDAIGGTFLPVDADTWFELPSCGPVWAKSSAGSTTLLVLVLGNK